MDATARARSVSLTARADALAVPGAAPARRRDGGRVWPTNRAIAGAPLRRAGAFVRLLAAGRRHRPASCDPDAASVLDACAPHRSSEDVRSVRARAPALAISAARLRARS